MMTEIKQTIYYLARQIAKNNHRDVSIWLATDSDCKLRAYITKSSIWGVVLPRGYCMVAVAENISTARAIDIVRAWAINIAQESGIHINSERLTRSNALSIIAFRVCQLACRIPHEEYIRDEYIRWRGQEYII